MRKSRWAAAVVLAVIAVAGRPVTANVPAGSQIADGSGPLDTEADLNAALALEDRIYDHIHYSQPYSQLYNTTARVEGDIDRTIGEGDAGLYTAAFLSAESYRYVLARQEVARATTDQVRSFWEGQRDEAKAHVDAVTTKYHMLINIAKYWKTSFDLKIDTAKSPTADGFIDFGGGVFPGEAGLLFRVCNPTDAPDAYNLGRNLPQDAVALWWEDGKTYHCLGSTSRDQYAGATNGLTTALNLVGPYDPALRNRVARDLMAMTDYALKYLYFQPRPHGKVVTAGNDLKGFISPLFVYTPFARLNILQVGRNAAAKIGDTLKLLQYNARWTAELPHQIPQLAASMEIDASNPHDAYYKYHLNHLTGDDIIRLEPNAQVRGVMRHAFGVMDATTGDDANALFEAMTYGLTGEPSRLAAAVTHHRQWLDYRSHADSVLNIIDYSAECGTTYECVPKDQVDVVQKLPNGSELVVSKPGSDPLVRSRSPVPVGLRRPADFLWQKDPTLIIGCGGGNPGDCWMSPRWEGDGTDFLQTYWMIRYYSEVAVPKYEPFPKWPGPVFR